MYVLESNIDKTKVCMLFANIALLPVMMHPLVTSINPTCLFTTLTLTLPVTEGGKQLNSNSIGRWPHLAFTF